ncbi:hypothetical protein CPAST_c34830 [Clostridium pasteurianum DSM 525 = ATCC 6013]|uniref:Uncharacterized protein n=1 Tax=Clostridium pasteurianum DSM 525 = ATCC 6013 TaxID=1262449 RepID=A0A0H3J7T9_CLOPA|nr:hypothetical protein [Clostridium pasteurianum]AJA49544.1 hypothetical protein CPAST_c34830 [Clostridium pasteurianum DSM 525 = ATCC 6013]AJA53532.1 hypothetical protein CLPA_c34830 [Clostridium pasteurianum DSM 525 = ATCC 6013]AOZ76700.1 hypothetical protein AQ983_16915 [Clostridium pasteurianum DSM 525 = ATCC 6013]AOZ80497.1 hypothetical protein AQ984_16910 [Clostridium pasteurianum]ELP58939.1 hypothetical protein F502_12461 [Clostridium pasteurianum DSM 525 = ATCC 6013]
MKFILKFKDGSSFPAEVNDTNNGIGKIMCEQNGDFLNTILTGKERDESITLSGENGKKEQVKYNELYSIEIIL